MQCNAVRSLIIAFELSDTFEFCVTFVAFTLFYFKSRLIYQIKRINIKENWGNISQAGLVDQFLNSGELDLTRGATCLMS